MLKSLAEKRLMRKIADHDQQACQQFVSDYMPMMYNVALRTVKNTATAEDITQDAFTKIWKYAHTFDGKSSLKSWLYRITMNACYDHISKTKTPNEHSDIADEVIADTGDLADTTLFKKQKAEHVRNAINQLSERERAILTLFYWENQKIRDIAHAMNMSEGAVESVLRRTRTKLKDLLDSATVRGDP